MKILPVIDLLGGCVVRGVAGEREKYRLIQSQIANEPTPRAVAQAYASTFGFSDVYIADLDAIAGRKPGWQAYADIADANLRLWIDAGVGEAQRAKDIFAAQRRTASIERVIVGLESLRDAAALGEIAAVGDADRLVFSLDLYGSKLRTAIHEWRDKEPLEIAEIAIAAGFRRLIILDVARVGTGQGSGTTALCRAARTRWPDVELISGGGVRSADDLRELAADGLDYALVASALHDGRLKQADVESFQ